MKKYDADYFIEKFKKIPANKWTTGILENEKGQKCALGHCGLGGANSIDNTESLFLRNLFFEYLNSVLSNVNDDLHTQYTQKSPKTRVLAALKDIKKKMEQK